ncbi:MAG: hypothetical protein RLZ37_1060 [Actinomycetota bacterium]
MAITIEKVDTGDRKKRAAWRPIALAVIGASVLITTGVGVFATLSASVNNVTPQAVNSGTLELSLSDNGAGFSNQIANLAPGDIVNRFVTLVNSGSLEGKDLTFSVASTGSTALITDGASPATTKALKVSVERCTIAWTPSTGACGGTTTTLLAPTTLAAAASSQNLISGAVDVAEEIYLLIKVELPDQSETTVNGVPPAFTVQGGAVDVTYTFIQSQRVAETTNS